jgi:hypothetical protein
MVPCISGEVKAKLSLCSIKYNVINTCVVVDIASGVFYSGSEMEGSGIAG